MTKPANGIYVLDYADYRKFLRDYYENMKVSTPYFSYRYFSKQAGFSSPNFFKLVMEGKRNLSNEGIEKFIKALKLKTDEARHFRMLVARAQAATHEEKDYYTRRLFKSRVFRNLRPLSEAHYEYYSEWYLIPLRELVLQSNFTPDPGWIADQFTPPLNDGQVKSGLATLEKLKLIEKTPDGGYKQTQTILSTGDEVAGDAIKNYHREMIRKGSEAIDRFPGEERDISSLTLGLSGENAARLKDLIQEFRKDLLAIAHEEQAVEQVVQVNFQLFPLTKGNGSKT
jgi:uncharacterized protein (TIGR02147 family)